MKVCCCCACARPFLLLFLSAVVLPSASFAFESTRVTELSQSPHRYRHKNNGAINTNTHTTPSAHPPRIDIDVSVNSNRRREACLGAVSLLSFAALPIRPAAAAQTTAEAIRRSAANLPGYGQPDVYYPPSWLGKWKATRTLVVSDDPYLSNIVPVTFSYELRFISVDGDGNESADGKVVADRAFNEQSFYESKRKAVASAGENVEGPPPLQASVWDASNPNVLTITYVDGTSQEVKVTKRAATLGQDGDGTVSSSEYRRVSDVGSRGIPMLSASRVMSKWKSVENERGEVIAVEGIEIVYADAAIADPLGGGGGGKGGSPTVSSKSRVRLERL